MNRYLRRSLKGLMALALVVILLFLLQVAALAFPSPWFERSVQEGNITLHFNDAEPADMQRVAADVLQRVESVEIFKEDVSLRVFVCSDRGMYTRFARLAFVPPMVPGFNLSILNNSFVCMPLLEDRARHNRGEIKHSVIAGDLAQSIAHEVMHDFMQERAGFSISRKVPTWKTEGYAEYGSTKGAVSRDPDATLLHRVDLLQAIREEGRGRSFYRWGLIMEYLTEVRGLSFAEVMDDSVRLEEAGRELVLWYSENR